MNQKGFTIIEIIVVIGIIVSVFAIVLGFFVFDAKVIERGEMRLKAISFAEEAVEAVRSFRDETDWSTTGVGSLITGTEYYPIIIDKKWNVVAGEEIFDNFNRTIIFDLVSRDGNKDIEPIYNPVNNDSNTRKVTVFVGWQDRRGPATESLSTYITNWKQ